MTLNMPYEEVVKKIISETELSEEEVIKRINEKVEELGGLITLEGAAHIIARELEINLYDSQGTNKLQPTKSKDLIDGMNNVTITALVKRIYEPKTFTRNDGSVGAVQNILLIDDVGTCRLVLWDDQIRQFKDYGISRGDIIQVSGAFVRANKYDKQMELSLSSRSQIEPNPPNIDEKAFPNTLLSYQKIKDLKLGQFDVELLGKITSIKPMSTFSKKDGSEGRVASLEIADPTGKTRITLWDSLAETIETYQEGEIVEIVGGYTRSGLNDLIEVHLGKNGSIIKRPKTSLDIPKDILEKEITFFKSGTKEQTPSLEVRLNELKEEMTNISIIARITGISGIRKFERKDGSQSEVGSLLVLDNSGTGRITFWNSMTEYIKKVEIGDVIRVEGAYVRLGLRGKPEIQVSKNAQVEINPEYLKDAVPELIIEYTNLVDLKANMRDVNVKVMVTRVQPLKIFNKSDGTEGHVLNLGISDETGSTRLVAWDEKAIELEHLEEMTPIEILHAYTKEGLQGIELHLGTLSSVRKLDKKDLSSLEKILLERPAATGKPKTERIDMVDLEENQFCEVRGTILKVYEGKMYYTACPDCRKKVTEQEDGTWACTEHGIVDPEKLLFLSIALDDGTGCIRVTFFGENAEKLIDIPSETLIDEIEHAGIQNVVTKLEQRLKGKEIVVQGRSRKNKFDDGIDLTASNFFEADPKKEIKLIKESMNVQ